MGLTGIANLDELKAHLYAAMQLEHATIPPYLTALYSIHPGTNSDAYHIIRAVAVEEMLHLTLAANVLNAIGGTPDLTTPGFVPEFPAYLPDGETDFAVPLQRFSPDALDTFLHIERPAPAPDSGRRLVRRKRTGKGILPAAHTDADGELHFYSIGEFYQDICRGLGTLEAEAAKAGRTLFVGDRARQITPDYYYSGGGEIVAVTDLDSAVEALRLIAEQGEGLGGGIYDHEDELSHYYRFEQLTLGRFYQKGDTAGKPTGGEVAVDWSAVFPVKSNARLADYAPGSQLRGAAERFNAVYADFLQLLTRAFNGEPRLLIDAVGGMFRIKELCYQLMRNPIGSDLTAAPTFEMPPAGTPAATV